MPVNKTDVSILIPTYKRKDYLIDVVRSVLDQKANLNSEILILDNECNPEIEMCIGKLNNNANLRYIPVPELGLHNCRNLGTCESYGELIVFIDDDVIAPSQWLEELCRPFSKKDIAGVGGKILPKWEGLKPEWIGSINDSYFSLLDLGESIREMQWPETPYGCNMAYRRNVILELGGFSPDAIGNSIIEWRRGDGETGFAKKIYDEGMHIYYNAEAFLYHRIPPERMTKNYIRKRTIKGAISSSYMNMRSNKYNSFELVKIAMKNLYLLLMTILKNIGNILKKDTNINFQISAIYYLVTLAYQIRLVVDSGLRRWVLQDNYLDNFQLPGKCNKAQ